jgi:hypothetical protein
MVHIETNTAEQCNSQKKEMKAGTAGTPDEKLLSKEKTTLRSKPCKIKKYLKKDASKGLIHLNPPYYSC